MDVILFSNKRAGLVKQQRSNRGIRSLHVGQPARITGKTNCATDYITVHIF